MITVIVLVPSCFALPPLFTLMTRRAQGLPVRGPGFFGDWALSAGCAMTGTTIGGGWPEAASLGASGLLALVLWWHSRRKRRRKAAKLIGDKTRAVLAKMALNMPRPAPRLVPQGARG